jgi:hypothetical protein
VHGGVEKDADRQPAGAVDVLAAQIVQLGLGGVTGALLRGDHMEGHVVQTGRRQLHQQVARGFDAVGEQRWAQPAPGPSAHDGNQFIAPAQHGLAARRLHAGAGAVVPHDHVDTAINLIEREVAYRLGGRAPYLPGWWQTSPDAHTPRIQVFRVKIKRLEDFERFRLLVWSRQ